MAGAATSPLAPGSPLGGYTIVGVIGRGGMGVVYEAEQVALQRAVALKVLSPDVADDASFRERFKREVMVMAAVDHPHICPVYEAGEADGHLFLAMRLVRGPTLKQLIAGSPGGMEPRRAVRLIAQAADALDAAHTNGLVHRDVKPQNILVAERDHAYLADFGLAIHGADTGLTRTGQFVGTLDYVAPEQIRGERTDARSDIYALGCVLYEALTGSPPYAGSSNEVGKLYAHVNEPPPRPTEARPDLPGAFDAVIERAMAKDPNERFPSAGALAQAALAAADGHRAPPLPVSAAPELGAAALVAPAPEPWVDDEAESTSRTRDFGVPPPEPPSGRPGPPPRPTPEAEPPDLDGFATFVPVGAAPVRIALRRGFRYVHQPLVDDREVIPLLGNRHMVDALKVRLVHSVGGSFLVTGFRGVGKTTVIGRALAELQHEADMAILPVSLNVARPRTVEELLFEIIRRVFETLKDEDVLGQMAPRVQRELLLAYARTSLSFNETRSRASERGGGLKVGLPGPLLEALAPKLDVTRKTTDSLAQQASFLAYTDADVEHDFLRIVSLVERGEAMPPPTGWSRVRRRLGRDQQSEEHWHGKLVVVIDELDKLTVSDEGMECIQQLLSGLKNLLTARGVHFLFVAGPDLHDVVLRESRRGNSVYESVFGWQLYVPCLWEGTDELLTAVAVDYDEDKPQHRALRDYLAFKSRGVPRLLLMELNSFVRWGPDGPRLEVAGPDLARVQFYAALERIISDFVGGPPGSRPFTPAIDEDRWRLGAYYLTDWVLRSEGATFTVAELVSAESRMGLDPLFSLSQRKVSDLLAHFVLHEIVEQVRGPSATQTYYGDVPTAQESVYRLARDVTAKLAAFGRLSEQERADLGEPAPAHQPWADSDVAGVAGNGRYELVEELDRGGLGGVYRAHDRLGHRDVAVKLFDSPAMPGGDLMRARFKRKAEIGRSLDHRNIVRTYDTFEEGGRLGVVMALAEGTSLEQLLARARMTGREAVRIATELADALAYVHGRGVARLDLKPSSVLVDAQLHPLILDLGLAKVVAGQQQSSLTGLNAVLGTPAYAAPEQLHGEPVDIRADIYSLGLILYEMLAGRRARRSDAGALLAGEGSAVDVSRLRVSDALRAVVARAVADEPSARFATPDELRDALAQTPEGGFEPSASSPPPPPPDAEQPTLVGDRRRSDGGGGTRMVTGPPIVAPPPRQGEALLYIDGRAFHIPPEGALIGRGDGCTIVLGDQQVSRRHALVSRGDSGWQLEDLGSMNGTRLNGQDIAGRAAIASGDAVGLGTSEGVFESSDR